MTACLALLSLIAWTLSCVKAALCMMYYGKCGKKVGDIQLFRQSASFGDIRMVNAFSSPGRMKKAAIAISDSSFMAHTVCISCDVIVRIGFTHL